MSARFAKVKEVTMLPCRSSRTLSFVVLAVVIGVGAAVLTPAVRAEEAGSPVKITVADLPAGRHVVALYLHGNRRCATCKKLEKYSRESLESRFGRELRDGRLLFRTVNFQEPSNQHYVRELGLVTQSLVVMEVQDGQAARWTNLEKIWELVGDRVGFEDYVARGVASYLGGP